MDCGAIGDGDVDVRVQPAQPKSGAFTRSGGVAFVSRVSFAPPTGSWPPICSRMAQGLWTTGADGHGCGRNRGRSGSTYGSPGAGAPAPEPVPAAAQRLPRFLWQPAASQPVWLLPPTPGRSLARIERASGRRQAEKPLRNRASAPIHEGAGCADGLARPCLCRCLNLARTLAAVLPLTPKGFSNGAEAPCGGFEDKNPLLGTLRKKHQ